MEYQTQNVNPFQQFGYFNILNDIKCDFKGASGIEKCVRGLGIVVAGFANYVFRTNLFFIKDIEFIIAIYCHFVSWN